MIITSCDYSNRQNNSLTAYTWNTLTIVSEKNEVITINNYNDTSTIKYYDKGSFFTGWHKVKIDSMKTYFSMAEKDTLYKLAKDIIANPINKKRYPYCTEFVGNLKLVIDYNNGSFRQSGEYNNVCRWDTLSPKTVQLNKILQRRIKWPNK
jgi:hypothetical protein